MARRWILAGASVLLTLIVAEVALRLAVPEWGLPHPRGLYRSDPELGYVLQEGFEGTFEDADYRTPIRVNRDGMRGGAVPPPPSCGLRILALGDSFTFAAQVAEPETYAARLERLLGERRDGIEVQVLNGGVPSYGVDEELLYLRLHGPDLEPDIVTVQIFPGNDFIDSRTPARDYRRVVDGFLIDDQPRRDLERPAWVRFLIRLSTRSHVMRVARAGTVSLAGRLESFADLAGAPGRNFSPEDAENMIRLLRSLARESRAIGAEPVFVLVPDKLEILGSPRGSYRAAAVIAEAAESAGALFVDSTAALWADGDVVASYMPVDAHLSPVGHRRVARLLADRIEARGWLDVDCDTSAPVTSDAGP